MREMGIDIPNHRSKSIEEFRGKEFDYVVTVCDNAKEACPFFPGDMWLAIVRSNFARRNFTYPRTLSDLLLA